MILQGVKLTIQPLGVGYANRPKKARNGGVCGVFPYICLPGFDLTTSARWFSIFGPIEGGKLLEQFVHTPKAIQLLTNSNSIALIRQVHLAKNLPQATHTQNRVHTT